MGGCVERELLPKQTTHSREELKAILEPHDMREFRRPSSPTVTYV